MTRKEAIIILKGLYSCDIRTEPDLEKDIRRAFSMAIYALEKQKPCEDCISKDDVKELPSATPQPSKDYISRQAVKELFQEGCVMGMYDFLGIDDLPSVTPQPKKGRWININESEKWKCSECERMMWFPSRLDIKPSDYKFCPNCGAKMEVKV